MLKFGGIQVSWMLCSLGVATVSLLDHRIKQLCKYLCTSTRSPYMQSILQVTIHTINTAGHPPYLIRLLVSGYHAHSRNERMSWVVHTSLNALVQGPAPRCLPVPQLMVHLQEHAMQ